MNGPVIVCAMQKNSLSVFPVSPTDLPSGRTVTFFQEVNELAHHDPTAQVASPSHSSSEDLTAVTAAAAAFPSRRLGLGDWKHQLELEAQCKLSVLGTTDSMHWQIASYGT